MKIKAKFTVSKVSVLGSNGRQSNISVPDPRNVPGGVQNYVDTGVPVREIQMYPEYDSRRSPEDIGFATATPTGQINFVLNNPELAEEFKPGQQYYVIFEPVTA